MASNISDGSPVYFQDGALRLNLPPQQVWSSRTASLLARRLLIAARTFLRHEQSRMAEGGEADANKLINQMAGASRTDSHVPACIDTPILAYMYHESPFNQVCSSQENRLDYWKSLREDNRADVLAVR